MALTTNERLQEVFSLALEDRSAGYADLVSNANAILTIMKERAQFSPFSGPSIRERLLYNESGTYVRYGGYEFLNPLPAELINDAEFTPKMAAVSVTLSSEEILQNSGENQLVDVMTLHIDAAEQELTDRFVEDLHSDGTAYKQIGGFRKILPTTPSLGIYGGISRVDNAIWRPRYFDVSSGDLDASLTTITSATIKGLLDSAMVQLSRGRKGPNLICMSSDHYRAYTAATVAIQRINDTNNLGKLGFVSLKYYGSGRSVDVVLEGGIGSAMPADTTYFIDTSSIKFRYHPDRNFVKFGGKQTPINQDAIVQHIGFYGELTMNNPLHNARMSL
jgi:hypothetical protein